MKSKIKQILESNFERYGEPSKPEDLLEFFGKIYSGEKGTGSEYFEHRTPNTINYIALDITFRQNISNSHYCPIEGVTNWRRDNDKPYGYDGFSGRVWFGLRAKYNQSNERVSSMVSRLHTGTGGYGHYCNPFVKTYGIERDSVSIPINPDKDKCIIVHNNYPLSFDCKIFIDDFPKVKQHVKEMMTKCLLSDKVYKFSEHGIWINPDLLAE